MDETGQKHTEGDRISPEDLAKMLTENMTNGSMVVILTVTPDQQYEFITNVEPLEEVLKVVNQCVVSEVLHRRRAAQGVDTPPPGMVH